MSLCEHPDNSCVQVSSVTMACVVFVLSVEFWVRGKKYVVKCLVYLMRMMYWVTILLVDLMLKIVNVGSTFIAAPPPQCASNPISTFVLY